MIHPVVTVVNASSLLRDTFDYRKDFPIRFDSAQRYSEHGLNFDYCESIKNRHYFVKMWAILGSTIGRWWAVQDLNL
jgi:hypothetical protein